MDTTAGTTTPTSSAVPSAPLSLPCPPPYASKHPSALNSMVSWATSAPTSPLSTTSTLTSTPPSYSLPSTTPSLASTSANTSSKHHAVAISPSWHLSISQIMAAGLYTASTLLILGLTSLMSLFYSLLPLPVVRGIQLSQGLSFAFSAISCIRYIQRPFLGPDGPLRPSPAAAAKRDAAAFSPPRSSSSYSGSSSDSSANSLFSGISSSALPLFTSSPSHGSIGKSDSFAEQSLKQTPPAGPTTWGKRMGSRSWKVSGRFEEEFAGDAGRWISLIRWKLRD